jgi:anti-sigma-K factor RskA
MYGKMTAPLDLSPNEEADALAAEYVLGVLTHEDRLAAEARLKSDSDFADRISRWTTHFEALNDGYASVQAPNLMPQIEERIFGRQETKKRNWWGFIVGAGAAAAIAAAALFVIPGPTTPEFVATLQGEGQPLVIAASYADGIITVVRSAGPAAEAGRVYELWLIDGDKAPVSLGLIDAASVQRPVANMPKGAVLAISLEPAGGSTTGAPTGPVLVTGVVAAT